MIIIFKYVPPFRQLQNKLYTDEKNNHFFDKNFFTDYRSWNFSLSLFFTNNISWKQNQDI